MSFICSDSALSALHRVLLCTQVQAYDNSDGRTLGDALDIAEYLVAILQNHEGLTLEEGLERFRLYLQDLEARFPGYAGLTATFDAEPQRQLLHRSPVPA